MQRLPIVRAIGDLFERNCEGCERKREIYRTVPRGKQLAALSNLCQHNCSIGTQLRELGNQLASVTKESRKPKSMIEVIDDMSDKRVKTGPVPGLTKEVYLEQIAAGETQASIGKAWNVNGHTLKYWIEKWNLKGKIAQSPVTVAAVNAPLLVAATVPAVDSDAADEILQLQKLLRNREVELAEMLDARNNWRQEAESRLQEREQALQTIDELNSERQVLLETIELSLAETAACSEAVEPPAEVDNVNHPAHYTAGKVECIDAIEAATIGLSGGQAYATGAAIKYLWRWSRKNGVEDLRKARWHIDRLIEEVGGQ